MSTSCINASSSRNSRSSLIFSAFSTIKEIVRTAPGQVEEADFCWPFEGNIAKFSSKDVKAKLAQDFQPILDGTHLENWRVFEGNLDQLIKKSVAEHDPEKHYKERIVDSRRERFYGPQPLCLADGAPFTLENMVVKICDFGHAGSIYDETQKEEGYGAETIVAPEAVFGLKWDLRADIWSVGASIFELLTNRALVAPYGSKAEILSDIIFRCGPCTVNLTGIKQVQDIFAAFGDKPPIPFQYSYRDIIHKKFPSMSSDEMIMLLSFLDCMLQMDADKRSPPAALLQMSWLKYGV